MEITFTSIQATTDCTIDWGRWAVTADERPTVPCPPPAPRGTYVPTPTHHAPTPCDRPTVPVPSR